MCRAVQEVHRWQYLHSRQSIRDYWLRRLGGEVVEVMEALVERSDPAKALRASPPVIRAVGGIRLG